MGNGRGWGMYFDDCGMKSLEARGKHTLLYLSIGPNGEPPGFRSYA